MADLIERLRQTAEAYPSDVFGEVTDADRQDHGEVVQRAAAHMGRHMSPLLIEVAAALEAAREDAARYRWLRSLDGSCDGPACVNFNIGFDWIEQHGEELDAAIDAARKEVGDE